MQGGGATFNATIDFNAKGVQALLQQAQQLQQMAAGIGKQMSAQVGAGVAAADMSIRGWQQSAAQGVKGKATPAQAFSTALAGMQGAPKTAILALNAEFDKLEGKTNLSTKSVERLQTAIARVRAQGITQETFQTALTKPPDWVSGGQNK